MALLDLLGRRWALRVLWELRDAPVATFGELQHRCGRISSSVLTDRLTELRAAGIVERGDAGYSLTPEGAELLPAMLALDGWASRWATRADRRPAGGD